MICTEPALGLWEIPLSVAYTRFLTALAVRDLLRQSEMFRFNMPRYAVPNLRVLEPPMVIGVIDG
jgi:hypothetical protein